MTENETTDANGNVNAKFAANVKSETRRQTKRKVHAPWNHQGKRFDLFLEKLRKVAAMQDKMAEKASLMNVEELLADFNWKTSGNAAALEKRLLGELHALEAVRTNVICSWGDNSILAPRQTFTP